jgi:hypothetical protein
MWLCLNDALVSIVQDRADPNQLWVRARRREHLRRLLPGRGIMSTPAGDYAWRAAVSKRELAGLVAERIGALDYPNFKDSVTEPALHELYARFWLLHRDYQDRLGRPDRSRHLAWAEGDLQRIEPQGPERARRSGRPRPKGS